MSLNAAYLNNAAADARARGRIESDQARVDTQQVIGAQRAAQAANGGEVNTGSNALLQQDAAQFGELDALIISNNAAREAYGYDVQADANVRNARQLKKNARSNLISSVLGGAVQGIGGAYTSGALGSLFPSGRGVNLQGQGRALTSNAAFVRNM
ncbi:hypothetical protein D9M69_440070 [compost metagenome]